MYLYILVLYCQFLDANLSNTNRFLLLLAAANETSLQTLTDIATEYCLKLCCKLKSYYEHQPTDETPIVNKLFYYTLFSLS